jgi:hypothetical protein
LGPRSGHAPGQTTPASPSLSALSRGQGDPRSGQVATTPAPAEVYERCDVTHPDCTHEPRKGIQS